MGFVGLFAWLTIAMCFTLMGARTKYKFLISIGAVMLLCMSMIGGVNG